MSLSRPAKLPLLKLPFLCIDAVIRSCNKVDVIFFALLSKKTRQIVKSLKIPLNKIQIHLCDIKWILLDKWDEKWYFRKEKGSLLNKEHYYSRKYPLVLQKNTIPLYTSKTDTSLESYSSNRNEVTPLIMAMEFLNEVFKCSARAVYINGDYFPESGNIGVRSTVNLSIYYQVSETFSKVRNQKLNLLLKNLEVTGTCNFWVDDSENGLYCDPKLFKCRKLEFGRYSADWVTRDILLQFEVPRLRFDDCPFSEQEIIAFVTRWFHSDDRKFEYLQIYIDETQISLEDFQTGELKPFPFSERNRVPQSESFEHIDFSKGLEIVRHDGLQATMHVNEGSFLFYIWYDQSAIAQT